MAGHGSHRRCSVDGWLAEKVQTQLGILVVFEQQRAMDCVGLARSRLRTHRPPALPGVSKYPRSIEEPSAVEPSTFTGALGDIVDPALPRSVLLRRAQYSPDTAHHLSEFSCANIHLRRVLVSLSSSIGFGTAVAERSVNSDDRSFL